MIPHFYILLALAPFITPRRYSGTASMVSIVVSVIIVGAASTLSLCGIDVTWGRFLPKLSEVGAIFGLLFSFTALSSIFSMGRYVVTARRSGVEVKLHLSFCIAVFWALVGVLAAKGRFEFLTYWELMSILSFMMLMWRGRSRAFLHSGVGYLIVMHVGFFFVFGGFMSLGVGSPLFGVGDMGIGTWLLFLVGFGIKSALFPLSFWLPTTYRGAGSMSASMFSGAITNIGLYGIFAASYAALDALSIGYILMGLGAVGATFGAIKMVRCNTIRGVLSYSSIENIGIIVLGLGLGFYAKYQGESVVAFLAFTGAVVHIFGHGVTKAILFLSSGVVERQARTSRLSLLGGIAKKMPINTAVFGVGALSLGGLVPFGGFVGEFFILSAALAAIAGLNDSIIGVAALVVVSFAAGSTLFNMARSFGLGFLGGAKSDTVFRESLSVGQIVSYAILGAGLVIVPWLLVWAVLSGSGFMVGIDSIVFQSDVVGSVIGIVVVASILVFVIVGLYILKLRLQRSRSVSSAKSWSCGAEREQFSTISAESWSLEAHATFAPHAPSDNRRLARFVLPANFMRRWTARLAKLQTGRTSHYIMHILLFLILILVLTLTGAI